MNAPNEAAERARIKALPAAHFGPLLDLLPALRAPLPSVTPPLTLEADGTYTYAPVNVQSVSQFIQLCYDLDLVMQVDWMDYAKAQPFHERHELIDGFDASTVARRSPHWCAVIVSMTDWWTGSGARVRWRGSWSG